MFYGERGIVNAILLDIGQDTEKLAKLLNSIKYSSGAEMIFEHQDIKGATYLLEGTFGEFGAPDLMIRVDSEKHDTVFFIIEAKVKEFEKECAEKENESYCFTGKSASRNNASLINIQLALRARFMKEWKRKINEDSKSVEEKSHNEADGNKYKKGRALKDVYALKLLKDFFGDAVKYPENSGIPYNVYYVSLTTNYDVNQSKQAFEGLLCEDNDDFINHTGFLSYKIFEEKMFPHFSQANKYLK